MRYSDGLQGRPSCKFYGLLALPRGLLLPGFLRPSSCVSLFAVWCVRVRYIFGPKCNELLCRNVPCGR